MMSLTLPSYSSISIYEPPEYSVVVTNRPSSPDTDRTTHPIATNLLIQNASHRAPEQVRQCIESWCTLIWILFLTAIALLHSILYIVIDNCGLPENSFSYIRGFFLLHSIFLVGMIFFFHRGCTLRGVFILKNCLLATILCFLIPVAINVPFFMNDTLPEMIDLNTAIQKPSSTTATYPCRLSFYKFVFGLTICDYNAAIICIIAACIGVINDCPTHLRHHFRHNCNCKWITQHAIGLEI